MVDRRLWWRFDERGQRLWSSLVALQALLPGLLVAMIEDLRPGFGPPTIGEHIGQGQHRIDVGFAPAHAGPFEAALEGVYNSLCKGS